MPIDPTDAAYEAGWNSYRSDATKPPPETFATEAENKSYASGWRNARAHVRRKNALK